MNPGGWVDGHSDQHRRDKVANFETLIILAGPSGIGKTTIANALAKGSYPGIDLDIDASGTVLRTDIKSWRQKKLEGGVLFLEIATGSLTKPKNFSATQSDIAFIAGGARNVHVYTLKIDDRELVKRYIGRMSNEDLRRTPGWLRYLRFGKVRQLFRYVATNQISEGYQEWARLLVGVRPGDGGQTPLHWVEHEIQLSNADKDDLADSI